MSGVLVAAAAPHQLSASCVGSLLGHSERVWSVSWHPSGELLASCSSDKSVRVWRRSATSAAPTDSAAAITAAAGWECCAVLDGVHTRTVRCVSWSPCGRLLASAGFDGRVAVWSLKRGRQQHTTDSTEEHAQAEDDDVEAAKSRSIAPSFSRVSFECVCQLEGHENEVKAVSWSSDGRLLASCSRDKTVWVWERDEGADGTLDFECVSVCSGHSADVKHVAFHPQLPLLLSAGYDNSVRVWREEEENSGGEWECAHTLDGHTSTVWMADWLRAAEGKVVAVVSASDDRTVRVWSPSTPVALQSASQLSAANFQCAQTIATPHTRSIFALHQHADTGYDSALQHTLEAQPRHTQQAPADFDLIGPLLSAVLHLLLPCVSWLATCGADDSMCVYEPNTSTITPASDSPIAPFHLALHHKRAHQGDVNCVRFHPSPSPVLLASCGDDGAIKLWKVEQQQQHEQGAA